MFGKQSPTCPAFRREAQRRIALGEVALAALWLSVLGPFVSSSKSFGQAVLRRTQRSVELSLRFIGAQGKIPNRG